MTKHFLSKILFFILTIVPIFFFSGCSKEKITGPQGERGIQGSQGIPGLDGAFIIYGDIAPKNEIGKKGDLYLHTKTSLLYGPKTEQGWPTNSLDLRGANGKDGSNGADGINGQNGIDGKNGSSFLSGEGAPALTFGTIGDFYLDKTTSTIYGPKFQLGWGSPINLKATSLFGKKLVTIGDSMTSGIQWQPTLVELSGLIWSKDETQKGLRGFPKMGMGGTRIIPLLKPINDGYQQGSGPGESIYARANFVHEYNPDIIILWGGQNDGGQPANYDLFIAPYTGEDFLQGEKNSASFIASYKGTLTKLIKKNPTAKIYAMTVMYNGLNDQPNQSNYTKAESVNKIIREVCKMYSVTVIDLFSEVGITPLNAHLYFSDSVHPNLEGGKKIADLIFKKIK